MLRSISQYHMSSLLQVVNILYRENDWVYVLSSDTRQEGFIPHSYCTPYNSHLGELAINNMKKKLPRDQRTSVEIERDINPSKQTYLFTSHNLSIVIEGFKSVRPIRDTFETYVGLQYDCVNIFYSTQCWRRDRCFFSSHC